MTTNLQSIVDDVYTQTAKFYTDSFSKMGEAAAGYEILYGPPILNPEILFLGFQPGGTLKDMKPGLDVGKLLEIPKVCVYAEETWKLAERMRILWPKSVLEKSNGLNEIFFRARSKKLWSEINPQLRKTLESFCRERAKLLVRTLAPKNIIVIGVQTFDRFADGQIKVLSTTDRGRRLVVQGSIWDVPAFGVIHLSGARISHVNMSKIRAHFDGAS